MALFRIDRCTEAGPAEVWRRLTDWPRHSGSVPLTRITVVTPGPTGVGTVFVARTGAGRLAFEDPMEVVVWEPPEAGRPGRCRLEKRGRVVTGWAEIEVRPGRPGSAGALLVWREDLRVRGLPRAFDALTARTGRLVFGRALTRILAP
ncbi:SRPBCC family protein [Streptomyces sp. NPDC051597]|uniref:SRPBCC family protein n=1 Tax=Streptomyces sp. NPDC051597 TaxID=3155049 RepID=UPI003439C342